VTVLDANWNQRAGSQYAWRYLFQGGRYDPATGYYHFGARDYSPSLGSWLEQDPLGLGAGDNNLYQFAGGDPTNLTDPSGLKPNDNLYAAWQRQRSHAGGIQTFEEYAQRYGRAWPAGQPSGMPTIVVLSSSNATRRRRWALDALLGSQTGASPPTQAAGPQYIPLNTLGLPPGIIPGPTTAEALQSGIQTMGQWRANVQAVRADIPWWLKGGVVPVVFDVADGALAYEQQLFRTVDALMEGRPGRAVRGQLTFSANTVYQMMPAHSLYELTPLGQSLNRMLISWDPAAAEAGRAYAIIPELTMMFALSIGEGGGATRPMGNPELGAAIREIAARPGLSAAERAAALLERARQIPGITFAPVEGIPGVQAVFRGARGAQGTPLLVVTLDGRVFQGWAERALIRDPTGGQGLRILITRLREVQ
jgi:RHS repeat-associated protein